MKSIKDYVKTKHGYVDLQKLKESFDLTALYGSGKVFCPWHDDNTTPNLQVYPDHVYCFACGKAADSINFVQQQEGLNFYDAVDFIYKHKSDKPIEINKPTVEISEDEVKQWRNNLRSLDLGAVTAYRYLQERGLEWQFYSNLMLGYVWDAICIPHFVNGKCVNVKYRNLSGNGPKYNSVPGKQFTHLYPYDYFRMKYGNSKILFLCEGEFDAMILLQAGLPAVSVPAGVNTDLSKHLMFFKQFNKVYVCFDQDEAGSKAADKLINDRLPTGYTIPEASGANFVRVVWNRGKDITDARQWLVPELVKLYNAEL